MARNSQQSEEILADSFPGWSLDEILKRLDGPEKEDGFVDPRNCLVIWARPSPQVRDIICFIQNELKSISPCKFTNIQFPGAGFPLYFVNISGRSTLVDAS